MILKRLMHGRVPTILQLIGNTGRVRPKPGALACNLTIHQVHNINARMSKHPNLFHCGAADQAIAVQGSLESADTPGVNRDGHRRVLQLTRVVQSRCGNLHLPSCERTPHAHFCSPFYVFRVEAHVL